MKTYIGLGYYIFKYFCTEWVTGNWNLLRSMLCASQVFWRFCCFHIEGWDWILIIPFFIAFICFIFLQIKSDQITSCNLHCNSSFWFFIYLEAKFFLLTHHFSNLYPLKFSMPLISFTVVLWLVILIILLSGADKWCQKLQFSCNIVAI